MRPGSKTSSCRRWRISRGRCATCMRSSAARAYSLLFFLSGATGLVYELLWVRVLYQTFGSTIQSVTTVVAAYMGGLGLGAWLLGIRASLWGTAAVNLAIGVAALRLPAPGTGALTDPGREPGVSRDPVDSPSPLLRRVALVLLGFTAFAALLDEIAWTRVLVMVVGGSTYGFTLVLLVFLLGIGIGSRLAARRGTVPAETAAAAAGAQALTAAGAGLLFLIFGLLPRYIIAVFQVQSLGAAERLLAMGLAVGAVVLIPAIGMA